MDYKTEAIIMKLIKPSVNYKDQVMAYRREFLESGDNLSGTSYLEDYEDYSEWLQFIQDNEDTETKHTEITASVYLAIRESDNKLIGISNIRHDLNDYLLNYGGHIGYSVRRDERHKGYATEMLKQILEECKNIGLSKVLITCDKTNVISAKIITKAGGVLEDEIPLEDCYIQRYWIGNK